MENVSDTGVITFKAGDEEIQLRFGMPANRLLVQRWATIPNFSNNLNEAEIAWLLYAGYVNACMARNIEAIKQFEFFYETVESMALSSEGVATLNDIATCYANSRQTIKMMDDIKKKTADIQSQIGTS